MASPAILSPASPSPRPVQRLAATVGVLLFLIMGGAVGADALRPTPGNLDGDWRFAIDPEDQGEPNGWHQAAFDDSGWRLLTVPGLWEPQGITDPRPGQPPRPKGNLPWTDYDGTAWYRRTVTLPAAWQGGPLVLHIGMVDDLDRTFVNGVSVGATGRGLRNPSHLARRYVVPAAILRYGEPNTIAIEVQDLGGPGGIPGPMLSLLPEEDLRMRPLPDEDRPFEARFREPAGSVRILKIVHGWPQGGEAAERMAIETLRQQGFGGVVTNVAWGDDYLRNPAAWEQLRRVIAIAREHRMALWLYDEKGYPSGTAGAQVLDGRPDWEAEGLLIARGRFDGPAALQFPPGTPVLAVACPADPADGSPVTIPLGDTVRDGVLHWTPPPGQWDLVAVSRDRIYEGTHAAKNVFRHQPYTNLLRPEPTARFVELTHEAYARELGRSLGEVFLATFTDEPSLMSVFLSPMPYAVLPWSPDFPAEFARRRGYALEPELAALAVADTGRARRVRYDFWQTVTERVRDCFTRPIRDWCRTHGIPSGGHMIYEEGLRLHVPFYGSLFACLRDLDAPGIDCLTSLPPQVPWSSARLAASAAELEGRTLTMCETSDHAQRYRPAGDTRPVRPVSIDEIRGTINRLVVGGMNTITSYYSFAGIPGAELAGLNTYVGRCCTALRGGHQVADIAVLYPVESLWPHWDPSAHQATRNPAAMRIEQAYLGTLDALFTAGRDLTIIDAQAVLDARIEGSDLVHGSLRWKVVVLPGAETLPAAAWEKLAAFQRSGGVLVGLALAPANTETDFPSRQVQEMSRDWFGSGMEPVLHRPHQAGASAFLPAGMESMLPALMDRLIEPDVRIPAGSPLRATHRRIDGKEVYFLINDGPTRYQGTVALAAVGPGELWDPASGELTVLPGPELSVDLEAYTGVVLRWDAALPRRLLRPESDSLALPALRQPPYASIDQARGEHVAADPIEPARLADGRPAHRASGAIRTSDVDTFQFLCFRFDTPLDAAAADVLVVEVEVPTGQTVAAGAHLFVEEEDGGEFLCSLGFALNEAGMHRVWVPWSRLKPVAWKQAGDGVLDRARIVGFRVGWGGYHGRAGERLAFTAAVPRLGTIGP